MTLKEFRELTAHLDENTAIELEFSGEDGFTEDSDVERINTSDGCITLSAIRDPEKARQWSR